MANIGTWRSPFPLRFGGGSHQRITTLLETLRSARPELLRSQGEASEVDLETKALARILAAGLRDTERTVAQRDPRKLTELRRLIVNPDTGQGEELSGIERWERILHLTPARDASLRARRAAIFGALVSTTSTRRSAVGDAMLAIFGDWFVALVENDVGDVDYPGRPTPGNVHAFWPEVQDPPTPDAFHSADYPGEFSATYPWRSALCLVSVQIRPPAATPQAEIDAKVGKAAAQLDDMLPAWMSAAISQLAPDQAEGGFFLGVSLLGLTAL